MHASEVTPEIAANANELYWGSTRSVNQIAEDLDLSKGALYAALVHLPSGAGCPLCGDEVGWSNRTARDRDQLTCPNCDWSGSSDQTISYDADHSIESEDGAGVRDVAGLGVADLDDEPGVPPAPLLSPRMSTIAGGAMIGAAVGLVLVLWARRR